MNLRKDIESGVFFIAIAKYSGIFITLGVTAILARVYTPEQFGIVNIATVFIAFFSVFSDLGLSTAVIQKRNLTEADINGVFSLTIWTGAILSALFVILACPIADYYGGDFQLRNILLILSSSLFFNTVNMVPNALLMKEKRFRFVALRSFFVQLICGTIAVTAAEMGMGIYALTINPVLSSIAIFTINYMQHPLTPRIAPGKKVIKKVLSFSAFQFGFQLVSYFGNNLDKLLMGKYLNMGALGYYDKSYRLMMMPLQNITFAITPVMHPVLAQIQDDKEHIWTSYSKIVKVLAYVGFILSAAMFFMSEDLIYFIFGWQWGPAIPCFQILSLSVALQVISSSTGAVFQAANDTRRLFGCGLFSAATTITGILVGLFVFGTIEAIAACIVVSIAVNFVQCYHSLLRKTLGYGWKEFWKSLVRPFILGLILSAVMWAVSFVLTRFESQYLLLHLCIYTVICVVVSAVYIQLTKEYDIKGKLEQIICRSPKKSRKNILS